MKKVALVCTLLSTCLWLAACGNTAQTVAEAESTEAGTVIETTGETAKESITETENTETTVEATETTTEEAAATTEENAESETEVETVSTEEMTESSEETATQDSVEEMLKKEVITAFEQPKTMYATIALNVRRGPSTDYEVVSHLSMAQAVEVTGQAGTGWYQFIVDGEPVYASNKYLSENEVVIQPAPAPQAAPATAAAVAPAGVIMVGDSRCVQMQAAVGGGGCSWVCENSKEYTWFSETAIPKFDQYVGNGTKVVINMGVNDPEHYRQYAELINVKAAEWAARGARTYLVSVNPVWENPYVTQEQVNTFNANVPGMLVGVTWIDTSSWLLTNGYRLLDGLHYDDPTYVNIFNLIMGSL